MLIIYRSLNRSNLLHTANCANRKSIKILDAAFPSRARIIARFLATFGIKFARILVSKIKTSLKEPTIDNRLLDDRGPTWELLQKVDYVQGDNGVISLRVQQSPIERAVARGTISEQHGRAAEKFYHHWRRSGCASLGSNWKAEISPTTSADHIPMARTELEAFDRRQIRRGLAAIHEAMDRCGMSIDAIKLLFSVVCDEIPFERAGRMLWPISEKAATAKAITYVRGALRVLTIEWGL